MIYNPSRRAQQLRQRILETMTAEELEEYSQRTPGEAMTEDQRTFAVILAILYAGESKLGDADERLDSAQKTAEIIVRMSSDRVL